MIKTKTVLYSSFLAILLLVAVFAVVGLEMMQTSFTRLDNIVHTNIKKTELIHSMRTYARERTVSLQKMVYLSDEEMLEKELDRVNDLGGRFANARQELMALGLSEQETAYLEQQAKITQQVRPTQQKIAEYFIFGEKEQARKLLLEQAIPRQDDVFAVLSDFVGYQKSMAALAVEEARHEYRRTAFIMAVLAAILLLVSVGISYFVIIRTTKAEQTLRYQQNHLEELVEDRTHDLEVALSQAQQANIAKSEFLSTVSHELRTPLTSIRGSLGLILNGVKGDLPGKLNDLLAIASNNTERLLFLINDILDIQKIESGNMSFRIQPVDVVDLVQRAVRDDEPYARQAGVKVLIRCATDDVRYTAVDPERIVQVLNNLISNAIKFSPAGGVVEVAVEIEDERFRLSVTDTGPGIPQEFQHKLFDKFTQADSSDTRRHGGTGLGLSIAKAILEKHGSEILYTTAADRGTTFYFHLPIVSPEAGQV